MSCVNCSAVPGNAANDIDVVAYGFGVSMPLGACQSFATFQNWFANNTPVTVAGADQAAWTIIMSGAGVTMGT